MFEFILEDHKGYVDNHNGESYEVSDSEDANNDIFVEDGRDSKGDQQSLLFAHIPSSEREVNVSDQEAVDGKVPLPPVLRKVACIPPVIIEAAISKPGQFCKEIQVGVEEAVENRQPHIRSRHTHPQNIYESLEIVTFPQRLHCFFAYGNHVLVENVPISL